MRGGQPFGAAHIGSAAEQVGGNADDDVIGGDRNVFLRAAGEQVRQIDRRHAEQDAELVFGDSLVDQELVPLRAALFEVAERLGAVELGGAFACFQAFLDEVEHVFLNLDDDIQQADSFLRGADRDVAVRRVGQQRHGDVVVVEDRRIERRFRRFESRGGSGPRSRAPRPG